jgi:hypothetical protein
MSDRRNQTPSGQPVDFSCHNYRFETDTSRGCAHDACPTLGSVFPHAVLSVNGWSLWLEYVLDHREHDRDWFWLMWYSPAGMPTIPLSGVFRKGDIAEIVKRLGEFIP